MKSRVSQCLALCSLMWAPQAFAQGAVDDRASRPPAIPPEPACELWEGTASGNDPSVQVRARLCPQGDQVTGLLQWSSLESGWNLREIVGFWNPGHTTLTLRDVRVADSRPMPGWRFCLIDHYDLTAPNEGLGFARVDEGRARWGDEDDEGPALIRVNPTA